MIHYVNDTPTSCYLCLPSTQAEMAMSLVGHFSVVTHTGNFAQKELSHATQFRRCYHTGCKLSHL